MSLRWVVDGQHLFLSNSYLVLHVRVFQDPCVLGNLLVMCQSKLFHSSVAIVWDVGIECFHVIHVGFGEDVCVERSPLVSHIENNLKWPMVLVLVRSKQSNLKKIVILN
jgi:hypothetical protein